MKKPSDCTKKELYKYADKKKIIERGLAWHVDYCPIHARIGEGKPYANFMDDCSYCEYNLAFSYEENELLCSGRQKVKCLGDLELTLEARMAAYNKNKIEKYKDALNGMCPFCHEALYSVSGKFGPFLKCEMCSFAVLVDEETGEILF